MTLIVDISCPARLGDVLSDRLWSLGVMAIEEFHHDVGRVILRTTLGEDRAEAERTVAELVASIIESDDPASGDVSGDDDVAFAFHEISDAAAETWRDFARPIFIESDLVIVPAWIDRAGTNIPSDAEVITIEPGATFGLGDHPTTRASLQLLLRTLEPSMTVLDVGCGSGILGIAALVLGAERAYGIDINPASEAVSSQNARANNVASAWHVQVSDLDDAVVDDLLDAHPGGFDLITANILAPVLLSLAPAFRRLLADEGTLIISGVLTDTYDHVSAALTPMVVTDRVDLEGWSAVAYRHGTRQ